MKKSVLHVVPSAAANPLLLSTLDVSAADYAVISLTGSGPLEAALNGTAIPFRALGEGLNRFAQIQRLKTALRDLGPQAVEFHALESGIAASHLRHSMIRRPRFVYVRHHNLNHFLMKSRRGQVADKFIGHSVDHSIAVSEAVRDTMIAEMSPPHAVTTVRNALRWPFHSRKPGSRSSSGAIRLLAVGRLDWQKDYPTMLQALRLVVRKRGNIKLAIAGTGSLTYSSHMKRLSEELGLSEHVEWLGQVDDIYQLMTNSDVLLHTARDEAFGLVLLEAMQVGLPVVSTGPGGAREVLAGFYDPLPVQQPTRVAKALERTIAELELFENHALGLRERVRASFDVSTQVYGHLEVAVGIS